MFVILTRNPDDHHEADYVEAYGPFHTEQEATEFLDDLRSELVNGSDHDEEAVDDIIGCMSVEELGSRSQLTDVCSERLEGQDE